MLTVKEKLAAIRAKRLGLAVPTLEKPAVDNNKNDSGTTTTGTTGLTEDGDAQNGQSPRTPSKSKRLSGASVLNSPSPVNTPTPVRARRFRNDPRALRMHWRNKELARARRRLVRSAVNSDQYAFMTAPIPDEEKTPIHTIKKEEEDDDDDGDEDYNGEGDEADNADGADGEDDEEIALRTARELEKISDSDDDGCDGDEYNSEDDHFGGPVPIDDDPNKDDQGNLLITAHAKGSADDQKNESVEVRDEKGAVRSDDSTIDCRADIDNYVDKTRDEDVAKTPTTNVGEIETSKSDDEHSVGKEYEKVDQANVSDTSPAARESDIEKSAANADNGKEDVDGAADNVIKKSVDNTVGAKNDPERLMASENGKPMDDSTVGKMDGNGDVSEAVKSTNELVSKATEGESEATTDPKQEASEVEKSKDTNPGVSNLEIKTKKKKKKQSAFKVQSVLPFSKSTTTRNAANDRSQAPSLKKGSSKSDNSREVKSGSRVEDSCDKKSALQKDDSHDSKNYMRGKGTINADESKNSSAEKSTDDLEDDESDVVRRPREKPLSDDETEFVGNRMLEDEAQEDADAEEGLHNDSDDAERFTDDDDDSPGKDPFDDDDDDDKDIDEIVPDTEQREDEKVAMASFHRKWEMEKEKEIIEAASGRKIFAESDEIIETNMIAGSSDDQAPVTADNNGAPTAQDGKPTGESVAVDVKEQKEHVKDAATDYMEAMFRRDDSHSMVFEEVKCNEDDDAKQHEARREQQRLLWKARQKFKTQMHNSNDDSLCHLDLFGEYNSKSKRELANVNIRKKLESACRPASMKTEASVDGDANEAKQDDHPQSQNKKKGKKRNVPGSAEDSAMPDWMRQKACLERRQEKRRRSVAVASWSYDRLSTSRDKDCTPATTTNKSGHKSSTAPTSLSAANTIRKSRTTSGVTVSLNGRQKRTSLRKRPSSSGQRVSSSSSASFKGLLSLLGQQAERHA